MTIRALTVAAIWVGAGAIATADVTYTVQKGDNLIKIARKLGVSHLAIVRANDLQDPDLLLPGQKLIVPTENSGDCRGQEAEHVVKPGETGLEIADEHGLTAAELYVLNPSVEWEALPVGARLIVEKEQERVKATKPLSELVYTAKRGDSLYRIATRLGVAAETIRSLNPGLDWERLQVGQRVKYGVQQQMASVEGGSTALRAGATGGSQVLAELMEGTSVKVLRAQNDWAKVSVPEHGIGWVPASLLKAQEPMKATPTLVLAKAEAKSEAPVDSAVDKLLENAFKFRGVRYRWGGTSRSGFDCSGFTSYVFARMGVKIPRTSIEQSRVGQKVSRDGLQAGDLVFFRTGRSVRINHVGIYVGDGKFIHASSGGGRVQVSRLGESYYTKRFAGARRVSQFAKGGEKAAAGKSA